MQHAQKPDRNVTHAVGPAVQQWQMVEHIPTNEQDKEEYERNKYESKSWKAVLRYPAPPQDMWDIAQQQLADLCRDNYILHLPDFTNI